ncbi:bifunctional DNA primase/polymerase [uncultured Meiothermus sp.]|uniref:bifunctional DNA primase/polymerase n=1 Tax=uncultured Meiothermus sp. TaxID=157471 RepID=UPI0026357994|nr:bifunctional DNA primase/polymerase [uncultured Meiothermus sp.]
MTLRDWAVAYAERSLPLVPLRPRSKAARYARWNQKPLTTPAQAEAHWQRYPDDNIGLLHLHTAVLDVDDWAAARDVFEVAGIVAEELLEGFCIEGKKGVKPLFRRPPGQLTTRALSWAVGRGRRNVLELRTGLVQDVLPPSIHPDTGMPYRWRPRVPQSLEELPEMPHGLLDLWQHWEEIKSELEALSPDYQPPEPRSNSRPKKGVSKAGLHELICAFNARTDIGGLLLEHGYVKQGKRYLAPGSSSGVAGVSIATVGGKQKLYSQHASDPLSAQLHDGHALDAFDVWCVLVHRGDRGKALQALSAGEGR